MKKNRLILAIATILLSLYCPNTQATAQIAAMRFFQANVKRFCKDCFKETLKNYIDSKRNKEMRTLMNFPIDSFRIAPVLVPIK